MLRAFDIAVGVVAELRPVMQRLEQVDSDLARQLRRAMNGVALNIAEGSHARGKRRALHYTLAMGSGREALAALVTARAWGHLPEVPDRIDDGLRHVIAILYKNVGSYR
ncbi:MAG: four helix bundle protein [Labilithrix sp.]|nr:four helix bundle protein [Labilithrix sp.]